MRKAGTAVSAVAFVVAVVLSISLSAPVALAGTQDFLIVNHTGDDIYDLYVAPSSSDDWGDNLLGNDVLGDEGRRNIVFSGHSECQWDILATDSDDNEMTFEGINLCRVSKVILVCKGNRCWADTE